MAIDRSATVRKAESLLGEGKLDEAIQEYVRLVDELPSDWSAGNMLGDLYVRAGDKDQAAGLFTRIADSQYEQGFVAKATAFYKKALKVKSGHERSLLQLAEIALKQELMADARLYLGQLLQRRRDRGDETGAAECLERLSALEQKDNGLPEVAPPRPSAERPQSPVIPTTEPPHPVPTLEVELVAQTPPAEPSIQELSPLRVPPAPPAPPEVAAVVESTEPPTLSELLEPPEPPTPPESPAPEVPLQPVSGTPARLPAAVELMALLAGTSEFGALVGAGVSLGSNATNPPDVSTDPNVRTVPDMKARFAEMLARSRQARPQIDEPQAQRSHDGGGDTSEDVIANLETAALTPSLQFQASAQLGRLLVVRGELQAGIQWLERAARAPLQAPEHALAVLYDIADALERMGDTSRALVVLTDIESDAGAYRDVRERIDRITRARAGGRGA